MIEVRYDASNGLISLITKGVLTAPEVDFAYKEARVLVKQARTDFGCGRVLIDARESPVQPRDVMDMSGQNGSFLDEPNDRMAIIVSSTLARMQATRVYVSRGERAFLSQSEALAWLWTD